MNFISLLSSEPFWGGILLLFSFHKARKDPLREKIICTSSAPHQGCQTWHRKKVLAAFQIDELVKSQKTPVFVIPAFAGIQEHWVVMDPHFRGDDRLWDPFSRPSRLNFKGLSIMNSPFRLSIFVAHPLPCQKQHPSLRAQVAGRAAWSGTRGCLPFPITNANPGRMAGGSRPACPLPPPDEPQPCQQR